MRAVFQVNEVISGKSGYYRLVHQIGEGGMGEVWQATDMRANYQVAIKFMRDDSASIRERFRREAAILRALHHPSIVRMIDDGETPDGRPFLVLELLTGQTLHAFLRKHGALPVKTAVQIARDVVSALAVAHDAGIVHRDLKPGNVFLQDSSESNGRQVDVVIFDFGIAKDLGATNEAYATAVGTVLGSHGYMSPEQVRGKSVDRKTDIWAFGMLLVEMIEGRGMFFGTAEQMVRQVLSAPLTPLPWRAKDAPKKDVPKELDLIVAACLERDVARRTLTSHELAVRLTQLLESEAIWQPVTAGTSTSTVQLDGQRQTHAPPPAPVVDASGLINAVYPAVLSVHDADQRKSRSFDELCDTLRRQARYTQYVGMTSVGFLVLAAAAATTAFAYVRAGTNPPLSASDKQLVETPGNASRTEIEKSPIVTAPGTFLSCTPPPATLANSPAKAPENPSPTTSVQAPSTTPSEPMTFPRVAPPSPSPRIVPTSSPRFTGPLDNGSPSTSNRQPPHEALDSNESKYSTKTQ